MTPGKSSTLDIVEATDSQLRLLYRRFRDFGPSNPKLIETIRQVHTALKEFRLEARDPNGLLNPASPNYSDVYWRQLTPILKECDASLKGFAAIVDRFRPTMGSRSSSSGSITSARSNASSDISGHSSSTPVSGAVSPLDSVFSIDRVGHPTNDRLAIARSRFIAHAARLASLLETMSSPRPPYPSAPSPSHPHISPPRSPVSPISPMPSDDEGLDTLKDRIDAIATRLSHQDLVTPSHFSAASADELWNVFHAELLYEGFSSSALSLHKDNLRAYIRGLSSKGFFKGAGAPSTPDARSLKEVVQPLDGNEKYHHGVKDSRLAPHSRETDVYLPYRPAYHLAEPKYISTPPGPAAASQQLAVSSPNTMATRTNTPRTIPVYSESASYSADRDLAPPSPRDESEEEAYREDGFCLISTRRLLEIDWLDRERAAGRLGVTYTAPPLLQHDSYSSQTLSTHVSSPTAASIERQNSLQSQLLSLASPAPPSPSRLSFPGSSGYVPPPPYQPSSSPLQHSNAAPAAFGIIIPGSAALASPHQAPASTDLGPDSYGNPIPSDAIWTRVSRKLISIQVLTRAGVRFEARPTFVAVLGVLSRESIAEYARQSAEARRSWRHSSTGGERHSPLGTSPPDAHAPQPPRRQTMSSAADDKNDREPAAAAAGLRAQTFPLAGSASSARDRDADARRPKAGASTSSSGGSQSSSYPYIVSPPATEVDTSGAESGPKSILKNKNKNKVRYRDGELVEVSPDEGSHRHRHRRSHSHRSKSRHRSRHRDADSPRDSPRDSRRDSRRDSSRHRDDEREPRRERDRSRSRRRDDHDHDRDSDRDRERERERERKRNQSRHREQDNDSTRRRHHDDRAHDRERDDARNRDRDRDRSRDRDRDRSRERHRDRDHERDKSRDRHAHQKSSHNVPSRSGRGDRDSQERDSRERDGRERDGRERDEGRKRFRDTISAAGIGGVAGSFFSVLTEAAHGL